MTRDDFREAMLRVMERKIDPAWPLFTGGAVPAERLHLHLENEYGVYVRDFPVLIGRAYVQCPIVAVRRELAENLYEEETGGLSAGRPHPELFLEIPRGLGMDLARFEAPALLPEAKAYRGVIDRYTNGRGWAVAAAVTTLFLEGTPHERAVLDPRATPRPEPPLERHPLVVHYGLPVASLALTRAHRAVEGGHRQAAWRCLLDHTAEADRFSCVSALEQTLTAWKAYRAAIAAAVLL